ncbi:MAG: hypothetical protein AB1746_04535 [Candidatus Zixiibacteriota bacterium]
MRSLRINSILMVLIILIMAVCLANPPDAQAFNEGKSNSTIEEILQIPKMWLNSSTITHHNSVYFMELSNAYILGNQTLKIDSFIEGAWNQAIVDNITIFASQVDDNVIKGCFGDC